MSPPSRLAAIIALPLTLAGLPALAEGVTVGVVAPVEGSLKILGDQVRAGASIGTTSGGDTVVEVEDGCAAGGGEAVADKLIAARVSVAIGFLCTETLEEALPKLAEANIPAVTIGVRSDVLMADALKAKWPLFRLGPSGKAEVTRLADIISTEWSAEPFALVDDGSIGNHDLTEALRSALEEKGVKPVLVDVLRPGQDQQLTLVRHLRSADVVRVFVAGDRDDVAVLAKDLKEAGSSIRILAGASIETTPGRVALAEGVQGLCVRDAAARPENADLVKALRAASVEPEGYVLPAVAAVDLAVASSSAAAGEGKPVAEVLIGRAFDTALGPVRFTEAHERTENPYDLCTWNGRVFTSTPKE